MIYHFCEAYRDFLHNTLHFYAWQNVSFRSVLALLTGLLICLVWGPNLIRRLIRMKVGDNPEFDHAELNEITRYKENTPTMGGILMLVGVFGGTLLWADLTNPFVQKGLFLMVWLAGVGGADDWLKMRQHRRNRRLQELGQAIPASSRHGLYTWEKLVFQLGAAVLVASFLYRIDFRNIPDGHLLWLPFYKQGIVVGYAGFMIMTTLVITATSNAVNLTDGMDGLATGCIGIVAAVFVLLCYFASEFISESQQLTWANYLLLPQISGAGELSILCAGIVGACLGFLWFNTHPAQVFMGDVGSLPLGGAIGYAAVVTRHELLLLIAGGVFVMEALSVIIQVSYFKATGGKRVFRCTPIHHHFHLLGWSEPQVVVRFWLLGIAFAALSLVTLKLR